MKTEKKDAIQKPAHSENNMQGPAIKPVEMSPEMIKKIESILEV